MAVDYVLQEIGTRPGEFYVRVVPKDTRRTDEVAANIANKSLVQPADINAVLDTLDDEIVQALVAGYNVIIDDFFGFSISINLNTTVTDPNYTIDPADIKISVNVEAKPSILRRVRDQLRNAGDFNKVSVATKAPQPNQVFDVLSQTTGQYTSGGPIEIRGDLLDLPNDLATDTQNGVFFKVFSAETRATIYMSEGHKKIVCLVPTIVVGTADIIVRTDYGGATLREGKLLAVPQAP